jgi:hypothetical protein
VKAVNRADTGWEIERMVRLSESISNLQTSCIFISYQREDEKYAEQTSKYILSKGIDVYFDKNDSDLRLANETSSPWSVTGSIKKGLDASTHLIALISPSTYKSYWVPFEIGFSYERIGSGQKVLKHKDVSYLDLPDYLKVRGIMTGYDELDKFLDEIYSERHLILEKANKFHKIKAFSEFGSSHPMSNYLSK